MTTKSKYFYGNKVSDYGLQHGRVDYATLAKSFDAVLANGIISQTWSIGEWEQVSGSEGDEDEALDIYQYYIVSGEGAGILMRAGEIVFYNEELGLYVWGVTHYGTSWEYMLTNIEIDL